MRPMAFLSLAILILALFAPSVAAEESTRPKEPTSSAKYKLTPSEIAKEIYDPIGELRQVFLHSQTPRSYAAYQRAGQQGVSAPLRA
jgi:hypothetical protein